MESRKDMDWKRQYAPNIAVLPVHMESLSLPEFIKCHETTVTLAPKNSQITCCSHFGTWSAIAKCARNEVAQVM